jgi:hypothetical protein
MIVRILTIIGSFASLFGLFFMIRPPGQSLTALQGILLGVAICLLIAAIILEIRDFYRKKPLFLSDESQIRDYMYKWISRGGRVAIFSHDMSWVRDEEMKELLRSKARRNELCICLPKKIPLAEELEREGTQICVYPELRYTPQSRFTIINKGRMDAQVAIGRRFGNRHMIQEFSVGQHPVFSIANDLTEIIIQFNHWKKSNN